MKAALTLCLLFYAISAFATAYEWEDRYKIWLDVDLKTERDNDPFSRLQVRNKTDRTLYQIQVFVDFYTNELPGTRFMDQNICLVARNAHEVTLMDYMEPYAKGTATFFIPRLEAKETFGFAVIWSEPVSIRYGSARVLDSDGHWAVDIWPFKNNNPAERAEKISSGAVSLIRLFPDTGNSCLLSI